MASTNTANGPSEVFAANATLNGGNPAAAATAPAPSASTSATASQGSTTNPEEIAWYFVESYYTTLNRTPERLHLFHQKKSSFIWGTEGDNVPVSRGRGEILERIKDLQFKDCKVRVTNVDSQTSLSSGIIVQVLGDMTNNAELSKRFAQTFFLAEQTNPQGYYVLNDIFRYLKDEEEEEVLEGAVEEPAPVAAPEPVAEEVAVPEEKEPEPEVAAEPEAPVPAPAPVVEEEVKEEAPAEEVVEKVEEPVVEPEVEKTEEPAAAPVVPVVPAVPAVPAVPVAQPETAEPEPATQTVAEPTKTENQPPPPAPQEPPKPAKPASWAALLAPKTTAPPAPAQQAAAPAQAPATTTPTAQNTSTAQPAQANNNNSGWQTTESRRQNRPVSISGAPEGQSSAYVRSTTGRFTVTHEQLKNALTPFGAINNVNIVEKKHAFVDFADVAGLHAAAAGNPHRIGDQTIFVEERRPPRPSNYSGPNRGGPSFRGGERQGSRGAQRGPGDRDRLDSNRNSIGGGRGQGGNVRGGGGQFQRGGRGMGAGAASSN
ncbi:hypothetical protein Dda_3617 [Drechslerella dactyloides]|uniref:NTF2-domain-containing protein n=1 Tax=Drechslerella dactyloides TaxID=74499 RepID=A0AAD6J2L3_DREDA|nr:hypothetical protein Dda_3617 [Drechslerella dactyloides]